MNQYVFVIAFLVLLPLVWYVLINSNLEKCFKQGAILAIRIAYVLVTFIVSTIVALGLAYFVGFFQYNL